MNTSAGRAAFLAKYQFLVTGQSPLQQSTDQCCALLLSLLLEFWQQLTTSRSITARVIFVTNKAVRNVVEPLTARKSTVPLTYQLLELRATDPRTTDLVRFVTEIALARRF